MSGPVLIVDWARSASNISPALKFIHPVALREAFKETAWPAVLGVLLEFTLYSVEKTIVQGLGAQVAGALSPE